MTRYSQIRALHDAFGVRAEAVSCPSLTEQKELDRVRAALTDQPVLNKDMRAIIQVALAQVSQVPKFRFREKVIAAALAKPQAENFDRSEGEPDRSVRPRSCISLQ